MPFKKTKMPDVSRSDLVKAYEECGSLSKVAKRYGVHKNTITYYFKKLDIPYKTKVAQYDVNHSFFKEDNEQSFYWAGFLAADGCISVRKNFNNKSVILNIGEKDLVHLKLFKKTIESCHPIKKRLVKNSKYNSNWNDRYTNVLTIGSHTIVNDLERFNIVQGKTKKYEFPNWLKSHKLVNHFMRGYFDGDGSIFIAHKERKTPQYRLYIAGNLGFLNSFAEVIMKQCKIRNCSIHANGNIYVLCYGGNNLTSKVGEFLYDSASVYLDRKNKLWRGCDNTKR